MLTVEIRLNGVCIAGANIKNVSALAELSDYQVGWVEDAAKDLCIPQGGGNFVITGHRRRQTVWALVAKAAAAILGQMAERMEGKG